MPDFTPTVIVPDIPIADTSPLERLLLLSMFDGASEYGGFISLAAEHDIDLCPNLAVAEVRRALDETVGYVSQIQAAGAGIVAELKASDPSARINLGFDQSFGFPVYLVILQDIVRRSPSIRWFTIATAYPHSGLENQIGGRATVVTADAILSKSTDDLIEEFLDHANLTGA